MSRNMTALILCAASLILLTPQSLRAATSVDSQPGGGVVVLVQSVLSESHAYKNATDGLISHFRDVFMKTQLFRDTYGDLVWEEYAEEVMDSIDIVRDRKMEKARYDDKKYAFTGWIFDLYAEIAIDKATGEVKEVVIEFI